MKDSSSLEDDRDRETESETPAATEGPDTRIEEPFVGRGLVFGAVVGAALGSLAFGLGAGLLVGVYLEQRSAREARERASDTN